MTPNIIEASLLAALERAINTALRHDAATQHQLAQYSGRLLQFELSFPARALFVLIVEDGVELYHSSETTADVTVSGSPVDIAAQLLGWQRAEQLIGGPLRIRATKPYFKTLALLPSSST